MRHKILCITLIFILLITFANHCKNTLAQNYQYKSYQNINSNFIINKKNANSYIIKSTHQKDDLLILINKNKSFNIGDHIKVKGRVLPNLCFSNKPHCPKILIASSATLIKKIYSPDNLLRDKAIKHIKKYSSHPLSIALLAGYKNEIPQKLKQSFFDTGTSHILAISGLHIGGIALLSFMIFRKLLSFSSYISLKYNNKKIAAIFSLFCALLFLIIADYPISAQRAYLFLTIIAIGTIFEFPISTINLILTSTIILLLIDPANLFAAGFQMSISAALILSLYFQKFSHHSYLKKLLYSSSLATIATLPFVIHHFGLASLISPLTNIIIIPITSIIVMPLGFISLLLSFLGLGNLSFLLFDYSLDLLVLIIGLCAKLAFFTPKVILITQPSLLFALVSLIIILVANNYRSLSLAITCYFLAFILPYLNFNKANLTITANNKLFIAQENHSSLYPKRKYHKIVNNKLNRSFINLKEIDGRNYHGNKLFCSKKYCSYSDHNKKVAILNYQLDNKELKEICNTHNLLINYANSNNCQNTLTINKYDLAKYNVVKIYIKKNRLKIRL